MIKPKKINIIIASKSNNYNQQVLKKSIIIKPYKYDGRFPFAKLFCDRTTHKL